MTTPRYGMLFHFTHIDNVPRILQLGALLSDANVERRGLLQNEAGDRQIKERRRRRVVTCAPGGVVADYVPFYFAARSPMMLTLKSGNVPSFTGDHRDLVYVVSDVEHAVATGQSCVISDRNAAVGVADFSADLTVLGDITEMRRTSDFVDWSIMNITYWNDIPDYPDRMERRMAEFLVHGTFPLDAAIEIGVHNAGLCARIERMFSSAGRATPCRVRPDWYYG
jgi:hypothetical protein